MNNNSNHLLDSVFKQISTNGVGADSVLTPGELQDFLAQIGLVITDQELQQLVTQFCYGSKLKLHSFFEWALGTSGMPVVEDQDVQALHKASSALASLSESQMKSFLMSLTTEERHACTLFCECVSREVPQSHVPKNEPERTKDALRRVPLFVLDNSIRETTVAQSRGHTVEDKLRILEQVKKCDFRHVIVGAFTTAHRVDDQFAKELQAEKHQDGTEYYGFTEICDRKLSDMSWDPELPKGLEKMKEFGIPNVILELDLTDVGTDYKDAMTSPKLLEFVTNRLRWIHDNMSGRKHGGTKEKEEDEKPKVFVNFRDFCPAMSSRQSRSRVRSLAEGLAQLPEEIRPFGLLFEDPSGGYLPEELASFVQDFRSWWPKSDIGGHLLVHLHKNFALEEAGVLTSLSHGADGIWCAVAAAGAQVGHACSAITITNLVRAGNEHVKTSFNIKNLRNAAIEVTKLSTGHDPSPTQEIYGARASDWIFDFDGGMAGSSCSEEDREMILSNTSKTTRIHTLSSEAQMRARLTECFPKTKEHEWDQTAIADMKELMLEDLRDGRKEEYMSPVGIAFLYQEAGGRITPEMKNKIEQEGVKDTRRLLEDVEEIWKTEAEGDALSYRSFYDLFMGRYFGCYSCEKTEVAFCVFDLDNDGSLHWGEFHIWLRWALQQYSDTIETAEKLLAITFEKGLIPNMKRFIAREWKRHPRSSMGMPSHLSRERSSRLSLS